ncbi:hypothetical protein C7212DRAFT_213294 [Tuber magnatum]|uniref:Uncharacterized protein n=1 Tax=Tuber magnatum TaxID=42249 RepID=A0A317SHW3_9PEZI|nr:hypothetical protein C7212DRAFT_213294 [Tuber magnatum]
MPFAAIQHRDCWTSSNLGHIELPCSACNALHWQMEQMRRRDGVIVGSFEFYCKHGEVIVDRLWPLLEPLNTLMTRQDG